MFTPLFVAQPHVFVARRNPLASQERATLDDLAELPRLTFDQGANNSFYLAEEILSTMSSKREIRVSDRATIFNLMIGLGGYTISTGSSVTTSTRRSSPSRSTSTSASRSGGSRTPRCP